VLREPAHALEADARLIPARGADRDRRVLDREQVVKRDLRRQARFQVAARQDGDDFALGPEVRPRDPLLVALQRLADLLGEGDQAAVAGPDRDLGSAGSRSWLSQPRPLSSRPPSCCSRTAGSGNHVCDRGGQAG